MHFGDLATRDELSQEFDALNNLDHQNIVQLIDAYEDKKRLAYVMEL